MRNVILDDENKAIKSMDDRRKQTKDGYTALMFASKYGMYDIISHLESEIMMCSREGVTALMVAVAYKQYDCMKLLLDEVRMMAKDGTTALTIAAYNEDEESIKILKKAELASKQKLIE